MVFVGVWQSAVGAEADLGFVDVDEDSGVAERTAAAVTGHFAVVYPPHRLFVDQFDRGVGLGLGGKCSELAMRDWRKGIAGKIGAGKKTRIAYLGLHDGLFESRSSHGTFSRHLTA